MYKMNNTVMNMITSLLSGVLFGLGPLLSGMANPVKVRAFLDVFGDWQSAK